MEPEEEGPALDRRGNGLNDEDLPEPEDLERVKNGGDSSTGSGSSGGEKKGDIKAMAAGKAGNVRVVHPSWEGLAEALGRLQSSDNVE